MDPHRVIMDAKDLAIRLQAQMVSNANFNSSTFSKGVAKDAGADALREKVAEIERELTEYQPRLLVVVTRSATVRGNLESLLKTLQDLEKFLNKLDAKMVLMFSATKYRAKIANFLHLLRSKSTQLLTSITLELLTSQKQPQSPPARQPPPQPEAEVARSPLTKATKSGPSEKEAVAPTSTPLESTVVPSAGVDSHRATTGALAGAYASFYGIPPSVKNYTAAAEAFAAAAADGNGDAMLMLSECYEHGWGVEQDAPVSSAWLEKAVASGCRAAMHRNAMQVLKALDLHDAAYLRTILEHFDGPQGGGLASASAPAPVAVEPTRARRRGSMNSTVSGASFDTAADEAHRREVDAVFLQQAVQLLLLAAAADDDNDNDNNNDDNDDGHGRAYPPAMTDLGVLHELAGDVAQAARWFTRGHDAGCPRATNKLGVLHFQGHGVARDLDKAFELFTLAATAGDKDANNNAGLWIEQHGGGAGASGGAAQRALVFYERGAALGSAQAMYSLGYLKLRRAIDALQRCDERMASLGAPLGTSLSLAASVLSALTDAADDDAVDDPRQWRGARASTIKGLPPLPPARQQPPHERAFSDAHSTAGDAHADLAHDRDDALESARDGVRWLRAAADGGVAEAAYQLGLVCHEGLGGVARDAPAAIAHFERAAAAGHTHAALAAAEAHYQRLLGQAEGPEQPTKKDFRVCTDYYLLAAASGASAVAMNAIGLLLEDGRGSADLCPDAVGAMGWYYEACVVGSSAATTSPPSSSGRSAPSPFSAARSSFSEATSSSSSSAMSPSSFAPSPEDEDDNHVAMQEAAVNLALLLAVNPDVTSFPSAHGDGATHSAAAARRMLGRMAAGGAGSGGGRGWRPHLLERLAAVLASMGEGAADVKAASSATT